MAALLLLASPSAALAQRVPFERTIDISAPSTLDVSTVRGKIEVVAGHAGRVVVTGAATVRVGWDVPANAADIARRVAAAPPIEHIGNNIRLRVPAERDAQRAVTVSYRVEVPPDTPVKTASDSGETVIRGITADAEVRTQSAAIELGTLSGTVLVSTGSGAVTASDISGPLSVTTASSAFTGARLGSSFRARTQSGAIDASFEGSGDVDVETGSSAIELQGIRGGLVLRTQSGRVAVQGVATADWAATTSSSAVTFELTNGHGFTLDAESRSGSVTLAGVSVSGSVAKRSVRGAVEGGGPIVRVRTGSGAIRIESTDR